jgi:uracil-DNA glycosylase
MRKTMDESEKARLRLWLRGERAMGLRSVPAVLGPASANHHARDAATSPAVAASRHQSSGLPRRIKDPEAAIAPAAARSDAPTVISRGAARSATSLEAPAPLPDAREFTTPVLSTQEKLRELLAMDENQVRGCTKCRLCETRTHTVFGEGDPDANIFFIGEGPGETEDQTGRPFVGKAGELLNKMIVGMGLAREQVMIANIVKCRPPNNRAPAPDETAACTPYLQRQIEIVRPAAIVTLGLPATQYMLQSRLSMGRLRGQWHDWRGIKLMPTYHPAYVLRNPTLETRAAVWSDLKQVLAALGLPVPKKNI